MDKEQTKFFKKCGALIRRLRLLKNLTLEDMQDYGFSAQHFQKVESGQKAINFYTVFRIAKAFGLNLSKLVLKLEKEL